MMHKNLWSFTLVALVLTACTPYNSGEKSSSSTGLSTKSVNGVTANVPQYVMVSVPTAFSVSPASSVTQAVWKFGDSSQPVVNVQPVTHSYFTAGDVTVQVDVTGLQNNTFSISNQVHVLAYDESLLCIGLLGISAPSNVAVGATANYTVNIPSCMTGLVSSIQWNFGDGKTGGTSAADTHVFSTAGTYGVNVVVTTSHGTFTLNAEVVAGANDFPTPTPDPQPVLAYWLTGGYGACSATCGGGVQTRTVVCRDQTGNTMPDASCQGPKPTTTYACNTQACGGGGTNGGWVAYNPGPLTIGPEAIAFITALQPCSAQGFYRTDIANGFHKPSSCADVGLVCDLFETMGINLVNGWPQYMRCEPNAGVNGNWQVNTAPTINDIISAQSCGTQGFVRTGIQTYSTPTSCGDVNTTCSLYDVMGFTANGAWPQYYKCVQGGARTGTWGVHQFVAADAYKQIQSCSQFGYFRDGLQTYHSPTSCTSVGEICDMFSVMGITINGAWPHYMECR